MISYPILNQSDSMINHNRLPSIYSSTSGYSSRMDDYSIRSTVHKKENEISIGFDDYYNGHQSYESSSRLKDQFYENETKYYGKSISRSLSKFKDSFYESKSRSNKITIHELKEQIRKSDDKDYRDSNYDKLKPEISSFKELNLSTNLIKGLEHMYIEKPNQLQCILLPELMRNKNKDLYIRTRPQSGKKSAFLIHAIDRIDTKTNKLQVIIVVPTAELSLYLTELGQQMAKYRSVSIGYATKDSDLKNQVHILISTPGSLLRLFESNKFCNIDSVKCFIIDEIELQLSSIDNARKIRQMVYHLKVADCKQFQFYSNCTGDYTLDFVRYQVNKNVIIFNWLNSNLMKRFRQYYVHSRTPIDNYNALVKILKKISIEKVIIYVSRKESASIVFNDLKREGFRNLMLLSSKTHVEDRLQVNNAFNSSKQAILILNYPLLIGLNLDDLSMVINYDLQIDNLKYIHEYYHKICKCKINKPAFVINLVDNQSKQSIYDLERFFNFEMIKLDIGSSRWRDSRPY